MHYKLICKNKISVLYYVGGSHSKSGIGGEKEAQRQGDFDENSINSKSKR
jgi:hypothetical protein